MNDLWTLKEPRAEMGQRNIRHTQGCDTKTDNVIY